MSKKPDPENFESFEAYITARVRHAREQGMVHSGEDEWRLRDEIRGRHGVRSGKDEALWAADFRSRHGAHSGDDRRQRAHDNPDLVFEKPRSR